MDVGLFTEPLLAEPALLAEPSDVGGERAERVEHPPTIADLRQPY
jgi:hypothetical protein